ncbi:MAG: hypothetical protein M1835_005657 [Candelina submexicana]|nr:MAG: hypothetical protein M1835_005657 [Candelina submexicana]
MKLLVALTATPAFAHAFSDVPSHMDTLLVGRGMASRAGCLKDRFGYKVSFPGLTTDTLNGYWSIQEQNVLPTCRITPNTTQDMSDFVKELATLQCQFAVRGGGHMFWAGAANLQDGVTLDLGAMGQATVSDDHTITFTGGGARWRDICQRNSKY